MKDILTITGKIHFTLLDEFGKIKQDFWTPNLVVTSGKNWIASRMSSASSSVMTHLAAGTSSTAPAAGDTTLGAEIYREALSVSGGTPSGNTVTYTTTLSAGEGTGTLAEVGLFNNSSGGTMAARSTFTAIPKAAGDTLVINWTLTIN